MFRIETADGQYYGHAYSEERAIEIADEAASLPDVEETFIVKKIAREDLYDLETDRFTLVYET